MESWILRKENGGSFKSMEDGISGNLRNKERKIENKKIKEKKILAFNSKVKKKSDSPTTFFHDRRPVYLSHANRSHE